MAQQRTIGSYVSSPAVDARSVDGVPHRSRRPAFRKVFEVRLGPGVRKKTLRHVRRTIAGGERWQRTLMTRSAKAHARPGSRTSKNGSSRSLAVGWWRGNPTRCLRSNAKLSGAAFLEFEIAAERRGSSDSGTQ